MYTPPSPQYLLHCKDPSYEGMVFFYKVLDTLTLPPMDGPLDIALLHVHGKNPKTPKSVKAGVIELLKPYRDDSPEIPLYIGTIACSQHNYFTASFFFDEAAQRGSITAMNALGDLYLRHPEEFSTNISEPRDQAKRWFKRAIRLGSTDALSNLASVYYDEDMFEVALKYYSEHFKRKELPMTAFRIAECLVNLEKGDEADKWYRLSASKGIDKAVAALSDQNELWQKLYSVIEDRLPDFRSVIPDELRVYTKEESEIIMNMPPNYTHIRPDVNQRQQYSMISMHYPLEHSSTALESFDQAPLFPSNSPLHILLKAFELASPVYEERNLSLANALLNRLDPNVVFNSHIFQKKITSSRVYDRVRGAFIAYHLKHYLLALSLFRDAANESITIGILMCGIMTFHGIGTERDIVMAVNYFEKLPADPMGLVYLSNSLHDANYLVRASHLVGLDPNSMGIYEWIANEFLKGVKVPRDRRIATIWYGMAYAKTSEVCFESRPILRVLSELHDEPPEMGDPMGFM